MNLNEIVLAMSEIESNRNVSKEIIVEALQDSLARAYRKDIGVADAMVDVEVDELSGDMKVYHKFLVVETVEDDELEVEYDEIIETHPELKVGDYYRKEISIEKLGRAAATLAKNVIKQKIREAEKQAIYDEYIDQQGELVSGIIESVEERFIVVNLGKSLAIMPKTAQIPGEYYRENNMIKVVITEVNRDTKGSQIIVSRADELLVRRLFENEVPEIFEGQVEIKAIAREAGDRTKVAVYSNDSDIDPIGACIGPRGARVQNIIEELKGEKIDIFEWSHDDIELIQNALAPAEVIAVFPSDKKGLIVVVADDQLSLAIGKRGKNARLAVKLVKQKIDIKSVSQIEAEGINYVEEMAKFRAQLNVEQAAKEILDSPVQEVVETLDEQIDVIETIGEREVEVTEVEEVEVVGEVDETYEPEIKVSKKDIYKPRTDYVSKFEELADASKTDETQPVRRRRYDDKDKEKDKVIKTSEILKEKDYEIVPEYTEEELAEIAKQQELEESSWYEDDIDFDEYDDYYDQE